MPHPPRNSCKENTSLDMAHLMWLWVDTLMPICMFENSKLQLQDEPIKMFPHSHMDILFTINSSFERLFHNSISKAQTTHAEVYKVMGISHRTSAQWDAKWSHSLPHGFHAMKCPSISLSYVTLLIHEIRFFPMNFWICGCKSRMVLNIYDFSRWDTIWDRLLPELFFTTAPPFLVFSFKGQPLLSTLPFQSTLYSQN